MPVPSIYKKGNMCRDERNKMWEIPVGIITIYLWAGSAYKSYPANPNLNYNSYEHFHFGWASSDNLVQAKGLLNKCPVNIYTNNMSRTDVDVLYDSLCDEQGIDKEDNFFVVSKNNGRE